MIDIFLCSFLILLYYIALEQGLAKLEIASLSLFPALIDIRWLGGRVVMQRPAKPWTPVRVRPQPF